MNEYVIVVALLQILQRNILIKRNIEYICFHFEIDGKEYVDDLGKSISFDEFYKSMENGADTKTS